MSTSHTETPFVRGVDLLRQGKVERALETLEGAHQADPENQEIIGSLAWACLGHGRRDRARELYELLLRLNPECQEARFRLKRMQIEDDGYSKELFAELCDTLEACGLDLPWADVIRIPESRDDAPLAAQTARRALRLFPENTQLAALSARCEARLQRERQRAGRARKRAIAERLGAKRVLNHLLSYGMIRDMLRDSSAGSSDQLTLCLRDFYEQGSVQAVFPQAPAGLRAGQFDAHWEKCECGWFRWMQAQSGISGKPSGRLLDVGAGPGHLGHHFVKWGYDVTALSGSDEELEECTRRGMTPLKAEMHSVPLPGNSLQAVLASHVLEHSVAPMIMLWEFRRLLEPGGLLYINLPLPNDGEPREHFPEAWDPETDTYRFDSDELNNAVAPEITYYTYGFPPHIFVLTYWQWRWVFRQAGLEHIASAMDIPGTGIVEAQKALASKPAPPLHWNQLFVLRNPESR